MFFMALPASFAYLAITAGSRPVSLMGDRLHTTPHFLIEVSTQLRLEIRTWFFNFPIASAGTVFSFTIPHHLLPIAFLVAIVSMTTYLPL